MSPSPDHQILNVKNPCHIFGIGAVLKVRFESAKGNLVGLPSAMRWPTSLSAQTSLNVFSSSTFDKYGQILCPIFSI